MRQRLAIAQAMLGLPDLLVLDEPTNGLDPPQIHAMREVLRSYAATGRTVIVSSHLLAEVEQTCSHVVVMAKGQKIAQGTVEEIVGTGGAVLDRAGRRRRHRPRDRRPRRAARRRPPSAPTRGWSPTSTATGRARALQALVDGGHRGRPVHAAPPAGGRVPGAGGGVMTRSDEWPTWPPSTCSRPARSAGYRPERTLRLSVELRRQFKRRRTIGVFVLMVALPLILIARAAAGRQRGGAGRTAGSTWSTSPRPAG